MTGGPGFWVVAFVGGIGLALWQYAGPERRTRAAILPFVLRSLALSVVLALIGDAPLGSVRHIAPYAALDVSASWRSSGDSTVWARATHAAREARADTILLVGDSVRSGPIPSVPDDRSSRIGPLVERSRATGRPVLLITDGRIDDPERLAGLPVGSRIIVPESAARPDAAVMSIDGPTAVTTGDTVTFSVLVAAGAAGAEAGRIVFILDQDVLRDTIIGALPSFGEYELRLRVPVRGEPGTRRLRAVVSTAHDAVPRNDTLSMPLHVMRGVSAVFVSTAPDYDARYALEILRGTLAIPAHGYVRVAPGQWRRDDGLTAVNERDVRQALAESPMAVLHGDTALFGPPRALTHGALALLVPPAQRGEDYYAVGAPPSPVSNALAGVSWDSLPPVELGPAAPGAEWVAIVARRARRLEERGLAFGVSQPRRIVVIPAAGLFRWRFRGGASADAFAAFWGAIFDWMAGMPATTEAAGLHPVRGAPEWLPGRPTVRAGAVGTAPAGDSTPRARGAWWLYAVAILSLCGEWILRRRIGLR